MNARLDVIGIGNAMVDAIIPSTKEDVLKNGINRDSMNLIDEQVKNNLHDKYSIKEMIGGGSLGFHLTTTASTALITVTAEYIIKINSILVANVDGTNAATCDACIVKQNATPLGITNYDISGTFYIAKTVNVPADDILVLVDKPFYLMETDY